MVNSLMACEIVLAMSYFCCSLYTNTPTTKTTNVGLEPPLGYVTDDQHQVL